MMKTSTFAAHVTDLRRKTSTVGSQLTVRGGFCRGLLSPTDREGFNWDLLPPTVRVGSCRGWLSPEGEEELRAKRDESFAMGLVLVVLLGLLVVVGLLVLWGSGGICRNHATALMFSGSMESENGGDVRRRQVVEE
jgi:hypothetical protein